MPLRNGKVRINRHVDLRTEPMSYPSRPNLRHVLHTGDIASRVLDLLYHLRIYAVQETRKDGLARLPDDHQYRHRDEQPHDGVRQRVTEPHPDSSDQHRETRPAVR